MYEKIMNFFDQIINTKKIKQIDFNKKTIYHNGVLNREKVKLKVDEISLELEPNVNLHIIFEGLENIQQIETNLGNVTFNGNVKSIDKVSTSLGNVNIHDLGSLNSISTTLGNVKVVKANNLNNMKVSTTLGNVKINY